MDAVTAQSTPSSKFHRELLLMLSLYLPEQYRLRNGLQLFALRRDRTEQILP
jgi:hypothetical protein